MARVRHLNAPTFKDAFAGFNNLANNIQSTSQKIINRADRKDASIANNKYRDDVFNEKIKQNSFMNAFKQKEYNNKQKQLQAKEAANTEVLKATRPDVYANIGQEYGSVPSVENANKMNAVTGNIDINAIKPTKSKYQIIKTNEGFAAIDPSNPTAQPIKIGNGIMPYEKPKTMTPYQEEAIRLRNEATDLKTKQAQQKAIANLSAVDDWDSLNPNGQQQMIDYYNKTGLIPEIIDPWFDGKGAYPDIPLSPEQKKAKENQLAKDFQFLMQ